MATVTGDLVQRFEVQAAGVALHAAVKYRGPAQLTAGITLTLTDSQSGAAVTLFIGADQAKELGTNIGYAANTAQRTGKRLRAALEAADDGEAAKAVSDALRDKGSAP